MPPHPPQTLVLPKSWQASWLRLWTLRQCAAVCVGSTPPADMCTKVSGFAFRVQAWTHGWGQGCNFWRQKTAGQHVHNGSHGSKKFKVGYHSGFKWGKVFFFFLTKWTFYYIITKHQEILSDCLTHKNPSPLHRLLIYQVLLLYHVSIVKKTVWWPHLSATELTHSTTMQEHSIVQRNSSPQTLFIYKQ